MTDVSQDQWFLLPPPGDMLAEVQTRKFGTLTYAKSGNQAEDISVFSRERRRTMSIYPSAESSSNGASSTTRTRWRTSM